jgi:hypothetical protein
MADGLASGEPAAAVGRAYGPFPSGDNLPNGSPSAPCAGTPPTNDLPPELKSALYDVAIKNNCASFALVAEAHFDFLDLDCTYPQGRLLSAQYFPKLLDAFYQCHGHIVQSIFCYHTEAAAALTDRDEIWFKLPRENRDHHELCKLMMHCHMVYSEATRILANDRVERGICVSLLFTVFGHLVNSVDLEQQRADASRNGRSDPLLGSKFPLLDDAVALLDLAETYYRRAAQQVAKRWYSSGVGWGVVGLGVVAALILAAWNFEWPDLPHDTADPNAHLSVLLVSIIAGGIGAAVSVMTRMTSGKLSLDYRAPRSMLMKLGAFRVVIGAIFGVALYLLLMGGLFPMLAPEPVSGPVVPGRLSDLNPGNPVSGSSTRQDEWLFFYAALAFVAGFSERFAQDMLTVSEKSFTGTSPDPKEIPSLAKTTQHRNQARD